MKILDIVIVLSFALVFMYVFLSMRRGGERRKESTCTCRDKPEVMGVYMPSLNTHPSPNRPNHEYR